MSGIVRLVVLRSLGELRRGGLVDGGSGLDDGGGLLGALEAPGRELWALGDGPQQASCLGCPERCHGEMKNVLPVARGRLIN